MEYIFFLFTDERQETLRAADHVRLFGLHAYRVIHKVNCYVKVPTAVGQIFHCLRYQTRVLQNVFFFGGGGFKRSKPPVSSDEAKF
jgi:hypothetical protein